MVTKQQIQIAYSFFHQKLRVYDYSNLDWQKDDIEQAIAEYVGQMSDELYKEIAGDEPAFLLTHSRFHDDLRRAVDLLESMAFA